MDTILYALEPVNVLVFGLFTGCVILLFILIDKQSIHMEQIDALEDEIEGFKILLLEATYQLQKSRQQGQSQVTAMDTDDLIDTIERYLQVK